MNNKIIAIMLVITFIMLPLTGYTNKEISEPKSEESKEKYIVTLKTIVSYEQRTVKVTKEPEEPKPPNLSIPLDEKIQNHIYKECNYDDDLYYLIIAIIEQESSFDENAISNTNDYGLMQINGCNKEWLSQKYGYEVDLMNTYENTTYGIDIIKEYLNKWNNKNLALMCYNMGESGAKKLWRKNIYSTVYSQSVLKRYEKYVKQSEKR